MTNDKSPIWLHRLAISELCVALITLTFGALVTTKHAGMAFADWPTSDGYLMVTYPWLKDFAVDWNKFLEHGHRLAGMLIGIWSIALVIVTLNTESRRWVKGLAISILLGVICQGLLGGFRVQLNDRGLAMLHGIFAAIVFSLMGTLAVVTGTGWRTAAEHPSHRPLGTLKGMAATTLVLLALQYILGSLIRHQGTGLHEHLGLGILALIFIFVNAIFSRYSDSVWIRRGAMVLLVVSLGQVLLGLSTWFFKFGFARLGYVAVADSQQQILFRTAHMVWGVITLMTAVVYAVKVFRVAGVSPRTTDPAIEIRRTGKLAQSGGAQ
ncbi:COX15/CtaA family protein [Planctomicrobium sp. SH661]|uniref:COX15/CtaA family protein n=1 Tax=Planctomicrobium sp. SH661 TaxID=3448124 RepID=UPI003F5C4294